jgi:DNA-binding NarL/FixJ family response regulator
MHIAQLRGVRGLSPMTSSRFATGSASKSRIFIVDDHAIFRDGLSRVINEEKDLMVCGEAEDATQALEVAKGLKPDLAIVDISLPGLNGIELVEKLRDRFPGMLILILSMHKESMYAERALRAGANGYIRKQESADQLLAAIREVLQGKIHLSEDVKEVILQRTMNRGKETSSPMERLSDRESDVLKLIGRGYGTRQIANDLDIHIKTIETYRLRLRVKLGLQNNFELTQYAIDWMHKDKGQ